MTRFFAFVFLIASLASFSQVGQVGPRVWQDHLGLNSCLSVAKLGNKIYATNSNGIVNFDEQEKSLEYLSKINGLHDVGITLLRTNKYNNKMLVIYQNCNIDIINADGSITNYPDFKLKTLNGKKVINEVTFYKQMAYLACGFGLVAFDTERLEITDTYFIGPNATNLEVYQAAITDSLLYAATPSGLMHCNYKLKIPNNFNNWVLDSIHIPKGPYCGVLNVSGNIVAGFAPSKLNDTLTHHDTLYICNNTAWSKFTGDVAPANVLKLGYSDDTYFALYDVFGFAAMNVNTRQPKNYVTSFNGVTPLRLFDVCFGPDWTGNYSYWMADYNYGLYQTYAYYPYWPQVKLSRNGTNSNLINNIDVFNGQVAISPSHVENAGGSMYTREGISFLRNNEWGYINVNDEAHNYNLTGQPILDICHVLYDRQDTATMWASSWFQGLLQFKHNKLVAVYNHSNSPLPETYPGAVRASGLAMDADGNLWISTSDTKNYLNVRKKNGQFINYQFDAFRFVRKMLVDRNNYVWVLHERDQGITVFRHDDAFTTYTYKVLTKDVGNGGLESDAVYSIAEDKDGKIWVGTSQGIRVFYNSAGIFDQYNFDSEPIKIVQDGNVELLLGKETVTSIVIDGANNKWCGTESGGVYCFSPDGITQLYHFTKDNSPLNSDNVVEMNYNEVTGDIFIGTDLGVQSFRSISVAGESEYSNVFAYPNPVRPNYNGTVLVRGLVDKSIVKITDISGNLVWETKSAGGQVEWPVTTLSGRRVTSGVYIVYASTTDGAQKALTKVLVVN